MIMEVGRNKKTQGKHKYSSQLSCKNAKDKYYPDNQADWLPKMCP